MKHHRVARFGLVGIAATLLHAAVLALLKTGLEMATGPANLIGFLVAFGLSMYGQQRFTFQDRLQGQRMNRLGLGILFIINALAAWLLGATARGGWIVILPLLPAAINYGLLYCFSGHRRFKV